MHIGLSDGEPKLSTPCRTEQLTPDVALGPMGQTSLSLCLPPLSSCCSSCCILWWGRLSARPQQLWLEWIWLYHLKFITPSAASSNLVQKRIKIYLLPLRHLPKNNLLYCVTDTASPLLFTWHAQLYLPLYAFTQHSTTAWLTTCDREALYFRSVWVCERIGFPTGIYFGCCGY